MTYGPFEITEKKLLYLQILKNFAHKLSSNTSYNRFGRFTPSVTNRLLSVGFEYTHMHLLLT